MASPSSVRGLVLAALLATAASSPASRGRPPEAGSAAPTAPAVAGRQTSGHAAGEPVQAEMRNVDYRVIDSAVLNIHRLRGELHGKEPGKPPVFDEKNSFLMKIHSAEIAMTQESMAGLFNDYVFAYPGSPLGKCELTITPEGIVQKGVLRKALKMPFAVTGTVALTPKGEIRVHPKKVKVAGISVAGLMKAFGLELDRLMKLRQDRGVRLEGNDFLITPDRMLPPPQIQGTVTKLQLEQGRMVLTFDSEAKKAPLSPPIKAANYMYYQGGTLAFGKLTMKGTELEIVDADPRDPFHFFLDHYQEQLTAGYDENLPDKGLLVHMPDFDKLHERSAADRPRISSIAR